jgi:hypothetical protein
LDDQYQKENSWESWIGLSRVWNKWTDKIRIG